MGGGNVSNQNVRRHKLVVPGLGCNKLPVHVGLDRFLKQGGEGQVSVLPQHHLEEVRL